MPIHEYSRPELELYYQGQCQKLYVRPGSLILVKDGEHVLGGDWLTAAYWKDSLARTNGINELFNKRIPKVENLLFLGFILNYINVPINVEEYVKLLHPLAANLKGNTDKGVDKQKVRVLINAMRWYDNVERALLDVLQVNQYLRQFVDSKEIRDKMDEIKSYRRPFHLHPCFVFKFLTYLPQLLLNHRKANSQLTGIIKRLISIEENTPKHLAHFEFYQQLRVQGDNLMQHSEKLPDIVLFELFRDQTPSPDMMKNGFQKGIIQLKTDQTLLNFRLAEKLPDDMHLLHFISAVDRMRRTRNMIVHSAQIPNNLGLLTSILHKYTKIYLREVIYQMAHDPGCSAEQLLLLKD